MEVYLRTYIPKPSPHLQPQRSAQPHATTSLACPVLTPPPTQLQDFFPFNMPRPIYIPTHTSRLTGVLTHTPIHLSLPPFIYHRTTTMPLAPCPRPWFNLIPLVAFHSNVSPLLSATAPRPLPAKLADFGLSSACVSGTAQACAGIFFLGLQTLFS